MNYQKIGEIIHFPKSKGKPLQGKRGIRFNYYLSSKNLGSFVALDVTTKLFYQEKIYVRNAVYRVRLGEIEKCVRENILKHMKSLGMDENNIPASLLHFSMSSDHISYSPSRKLQA